MLSCVGDHMHGFFMSAKSNVTVYDNTHTTNDLGKFLFFLQKEFINYLALAISQAAVSFNDIDLYTNLKRKSA